MDTVILLPHLLVPVRPRLQVLEQMAVVIEGELIVAILPRSDAFERYKNALRENEETKDYADDLCNRKTIGGLIFDIAKKSWKNLKIEQDEVVDKKTINQRLGEWTWESAP